MITRLLVLFEDAVEAVVETFISAVIDHLTREWIEADAGPCGNPTNGVQQ